MKPEVTFCGLTYNNPSGAVDLVNDIYRLHDPSTFRIIWLDQTRDGIPFDKEVHLHIRSYRNLGFSKGMNTMWKLVQTPYTLLANDDVRLLSASWYEDAKAHLSDGVLGVNPYPALRTWDGGGVPRWYHEIHGDWWQWTKDKPFESYTEEDYKRLQDKLKGGDPPGSAFFFTLFRTEAREIIGLLDEGYINNAEDYDYNRRCFLKGYKILTCTHSLIHHHCGVSKQKAVATKEIDGYNLLANAKSIFNKKWGDDTCPNPDIYGRTGRKEPLTPWFQEIPL